MKSNRGFTLVELVTVIIILGILSVMAAPRFIDLRGDAQASVMKGLQASLKFVVEAVSYQSAIQGTDRERAVTTTVNGVDIQTYYGYPQEIWDDKLEHLMAGDFYFMGNAYQDNGLFEEVCPQTICVVEQIKLSTLFADGTAGYALAFLPKGYSLRNNCSVAYYFTAYPSDGYAKVFVKTIDGGC
ncbi:prepilin-type N-terminal cleavage/methylation domain-containing protein [Shewanella sp. Isolate11]|uniref:pilus assembly FimT family protein n=1 Tax=Shewanella sp. Isolate11 TaxID=2908530 RepID=UPI0023D88C1C|nr:prepilin-type N-terminal cleavage/methylation domain-containing protein [Shewanella sp. Isolate11]